MAAAAKRMATSDSVQAQVASGSGPMGLQRLQRIGGASGLEPARAAQPRAQQQAVAPHECDQGALGPRGQGQHRQARQAQTQAGSGAAQAQHGRVEHTAQFGCGCFSQRRRRSAGKAGAIERCPKAHHPKPGCGACRAQLSQLSQHGGLDVTLQERACDGTFGVTLGHHHAQPDTDRSRVIHRLCDPRVGCC